MKRFAIFENKTVKIIGEYEKFFLIESDVDISCSFTYKTIKESFGVESFKRTYKLNCEFELSKFYCWAKKCEVKQASKQMEIE